ncbi:uncharacterized protein LOC133806950 [Humulus lupulus]|uniref:uncharacterized protein LOC133806950 n=1 Tax=Humulus lupulus TaxID=3486 RepID=UPI002B40A8F6|nr:uncharacterized protein LOC133806950 [Humulus lupulus]
MSDVLIKKHEHMETAYEIWVSLPVMYGQHFDQCKDDATRAYTIMKMKKCGFVREHALNMINTIHDVEVYETTTKERTQVSLILESLTPDFSTFTTNYVMKKLKYNMTQLLNGLQTFESLNKSNTKVEEENIVDSKPSSSNEKKIRRQRNSM